MSQIGVAQNFDERTKRVGEQSDMYLFRLTLDEIDEIEELSASRVDRVDDADK